MYLDSFTYTPTQNTHHVTLLIHMYLDSFTYTPTQNTHQAVILVEILYLSHTLFVEFCGVRGFVEI